MAQPANTFDTYDQVGIREDLSDVIYNIDPDATPLFSKTRKSKVTNRLTEWQTDALRASADNAHVEGDDTVAENRTATVRLSNYTQIFKNAVVVSGTAQAVTTAGRAKEMAYQSMLVSKEHKLDIERALFLNQAKSAGSSATPRRLAGLGAWITTNVNNVGGGGANPTGDGSNARTDGSQTALTQDDFDLTLQELWTEGARSRSKTVYLSPFQKNVTRGFTGNNAQRNNVKAGEVEKMIDVYTTDWGMVKFEMSLENRGRDVWIITDDMLSIGTLRATKNEELPSNGDYEKRQIITELTLMMNNEKAHGLVADCSTS
jgi:hypothetical protein